MKKNGCFGATCIAPSRSILLYMKLSLFLLFFALQLSATNYAQKRINLNAKDITIAQILDSIERVSSYEFSYSNDIIPTEKITSIKVVNARIDEVLAKLFEDYPLRWKIVKKTNVVISPIDKIILMKPELVAEKISGTVTNENGEPIAGASVIIRGSTIGSITSADGSFVINANIGDVLIVSGIGFTTKEVRVSDTQLSIKLMPLINNMEEVLVVGYGTQKRAEITNAVSSVKAEDFIKGSINDAAQLIKGKVAGLTIVNPDANPLSISQIMLRGMTTLAAGTQPLVVIDGVPGSLVDVAPDDIESINVLKDGSAAAIYGTRGTNGVILITTKKVRGKTPATVEIHSYVFTQNITKKLDFMDAEEYRALAKAGKNGAIDYGSNTNWLNEIFQNPVSYTHNISMKGGDANTNYLMNVNYKAWEGLVRKSDNDVLNFHIRANHSMLNGKLKIYGSLMGYDQKYYNGMRGDIYRNALIYNPTDPVRDEKGNWTEHVSTYTPNPVGLIEETKGENKVTNFRPSAVITISPVNKLSFELSGSREITNSISGYAESFNHFNSLNLKRTGFAHRGSARSMNDFVEFTSNYSNTFKAHHFTGLLGYSLNENTYEDFSLNNYDFPSDLYSYNSIGLGTALSEGRAGMGSYKEKAKLIGYFGRLNYNFNDKYFFTGSIRNEGSSKFGENNKWGLFPSASVGWNILKEPFMENIQVFSSLKLRGGYGVTGTIPSASYTSLSRLSYGSKYFYNGQWISVIQPSSNPNPNLKWETKEEINIGLDFGLLKDRVTGTIDVYKRKTRDLLWGYKVPLPPYLFSNILANAGSIENKGIEVLVNANLIKKSDFNWNTNLNFSANRNKVLSLSNNNFKLQGGFFYTGGTGEPIQSATHIVREGEALGNFWGYKSIGIDDDGYWMIEDKDGNPKSIKDQQPDDKQILGNGLPKFYLNYNNTLVYKQFDLDIIMRGAFGYHILNAPNMFYSVPVSLARGNIMKKSYDNIYGKRPLNDLQELQYVSYYIEKGDYWKIDNITLGFTQAFAKGPVMSCRIYASGANLLTFTKYSGIDPEVNSLGLSPGMDDRDRYPSTRKYTVGISIKF